MKNLFFKIASNLLFSYSKRLAIILLLLSVSFVVTASGGGGGGESTTWAARFYIKKVQLAQESTGGGKVYLRNTAQGLTNGYSNEGWTDNVELHSTIEEDKTPFHVYNTSIQNGSSQTVSGELHPDPYPGSKFDSWSYEPVVLEPNSSNHSATAYPTTYEPIIEGTVYKFSMTFSGDANIALDQTSVIYAKFIARTYEAKSQSIGIITLDEEGNVSTDAVGGFVSLDGTNWSSVQIEGGTIVTQSADDKGKKAQATFLPRFYAKANDGYTFVGWASSPEESKDKYEERKGSPYQTVVVSTAEQGDDKATPPSLGKYYAVFVPTISYYHTGAVVGIAGNQNEWEAKGRVYADKGEAMTNGVPEDQWQISMQDETVHEEKEKFFKYTYYAKVLNSDKVAFKGWTTSPNGEPSYTDNPLVDYEHKMTDENTSREKPFRTPTLYAVFESYYYKTPAVAVANNSKGAGFVNVSLEEGLSLDLCTKEEVNASEETYQVPANGTSYSYKVAYYAKNKPGTRFEYWSSTADGSTIVSRNATYVENYESTATDANYPHVAPALYAVFSSDIDIRQQDRMIVYVDEEGNANINDSKVLIDFQKGNKLTATLSGADASYFTLSNRSGSKSGSSVTFDATQGLIELVVAYKGDLNDAVGKTANITLSAISGGEEISRPVTIKVEKAPIITFLPTDGKGEYVVSMTNGSGVNYTMGVASKENIVVPVTHESMSNIEIKLKSDASDDYYFFGWQMIDGNDVTYLSYEQLFTYQFTKPVSVRADFVHKDIATYRILNDPSNTPYYDFALVMNDAKKLYAINGTQTVMLNETVNGVQVTKAFLQKGNYTIPKGVQFIVPGKNVKGYREALEQTDYQSGVASYKEYIRWIVEEGTTITVEGGASVSVLANVAVIGASNPNGLPYDYGHIELNENCKMEFLGDSKLFAYGYVTGPESSSIVMKDQSTVKEILQIYDWRGGTATSTGYLFQEFQKNKVFLINQYFVQNIEAPLTITAGAIEKLDAALNVKDIVNMEVTFISQNAGFVQMSNGYSMTKYYDKYSDRIRMTIEKAEGATGAAELGSMALNVTGIGEINSADFVLPLPHNYDVVLGKNTETNVLHDMALLPGATVHVKEGAVVNLGVSNTANFFIYDQKYSKVDGKGYCGSTDSVLFTIKSRPDKLQYTRTSATIQDAQLIVDGTLNTPKGYLYTTNSKTETADHARITSNGGGKVQFKALGTKTDTKQGTHKTLGINVVSIPVAPARLLHGNGTYQEPSVNTTYTYIRGRWMANSDETEKPEVPTTVSMVPVFTVTNYATSSYVCKSSEGTTTVATNNANVDWTKVTWAYQLYGEHADQFVFAWTTKPNGKITFEPESEGVKKATLRITATYKYTDTYGVVGTYTYSKDIHLTGNATYLQANTLAFEDLSSLYVGQEAIALFADGANNSETIDISVEPANVVIVNGNTAAAKITPNAVGEVTITAIQKADLDRNIAGTTITKTIKVTEPVIWNWDILYFGTENTDPVTVLDGSTGWTLTEKEDKKNIISYDASRKTATIEDQIAGKYEVIFEFKKGNVTKEFKSVVIVNPQHLRVDVNNDTIYRAVTLSANRQVDFDVETKAVTFQSSAQNISQWKMTFIGVPDKIYFTPQGVNSWQIEESTNGVNWTTSMPWKYLTSNEPFEMSLLPSTRYVRISYGAGSTDVALLKELYITELADVKADVNKIYMPIDGKNNAVKEVVLTYANTGELSVTTNQPNIFKVKLSDSANDDYDERFSIPATTDENPFGIKGVEVVCLATEPTTAELQVWNGSQLALQIPIHAYAFPQELPIKLATDEPAGGDRYYYVTTHSHNAEWNGKDGVRTITMNNAVSDAAPYVTFAFDGAPTFISFDYTAAAKGVWEIEESADGKDYTTTTPTDGDEMANGKLHRTVSTSSKYLRVIYQSPYAEKIDITNLTIVGGESVVVNPTKLQLDYDVKETLIMTAINLADVYIVSSSDNFKISQNGGEYRDVLQISGLVENGITDNITLDVKWTGKNLPMVEYGNIFIGLPDPDGGDNHKVLATVELVGIRNTLASNITTKTGVPDGKDDEGNVSEDEIKYTLNGSFDGSSHRNVDISAAFSLSDDKPLFDYVVIYGETTTNDGQTTITTPNKNAGSNAKTPYYIYKKSDDGNSYVLDMLVENANSSNKAWNENGDDAVTIGEGKNSVSMYITGFCPYATTGYTKAEEGVWYFRANGGQSIDVYLEDCYIYSRAKTKDGHTFVDRADGNSFVDGYVCGSGAVLVFACNDKSNATSMNVTIHTLGTNILKSNYGCFFQSIAGRAFQASSPVQIRLIDDTYWNATKTTLNFTDEWPASQNSKTGEGVRTNGFVSLQKQVNNAPSIDMGAPKTVVNFNGGQVELQNAQIVSHNYKSSLAICPRSGEFAGILLSRGMATDAVSGTVNFNDGTTTVQPMWVSPDYFESYLCDKDEDGNYIKNSKGEYRTTCLRTPANTFVYGGSHCMMRACTDPESQGGAPKDKPGEEGKLLGLYKFPKNPATGQKGGWKANGTNGLVTPTIGNVPTGYNVESVTPNNNGTTDDANDDYLNFWFDLDFESSVEPEINKQISYWKTCMTRIEAEYAGEGGAVGGDTEVEFTGEGESRMQAEIVKNLLYCQLDENTYNVISNGDYVAPVKNPAPAGGGLEAYLPIKPSYVGEEYQHYITNGETYKVENKVYYITTATADVWMTFTAPFDVEKIWVVETYSEAEFMKLEQNGSTRAEILLEQAKHNADFASFFAVTIALGQNKSFETIYGEWLDWAKMRDKEAGFYESGKYTLRGKTALIPYNGENWYEAHFYLNQNNGLWKYDADGIGGQEFTPDWITPSLPTKDDPILLDQGETYSLLFPYCVGCDTEESRDYWDYWSGKILIFESTDGSVMGAHNIHGADYVTPNGDIFDAWDNPKDKAILLGNPTFAQMESTDARIYPYQYTIVAPGENAECFLSFSEVAVNNKITIQPTNSFLLTGVTAQEGEEIESISYTGKIKYRPTSEEPGEDLGTGDEHVSTIGDSSDIFVTSTFGGINIAVAEPQYVGVFAANGTLLFNGWVEKSVDVALVNRGMYVVVGENVSVKVIY